MILLGIDSSTDRLGIGLCDGPTIMAEALLDSQREHASRIIVMIDRLLKDTHIPKSRLEGIAAAIGPGSFTGLRVGLAVAKGIAMALTIPIVGVSTFAVMNKKLRADYPDFYLCAPVRKGELYLFHAAGNSAIPEDIIVIKQSKLVEIVGSIPVGLIGKEPAGWTEIGAKCIPAEAMSISGGALAVVGAEMLSAGISDNMVTLEPLYIAPSQAEEKFGRT